MGKPFGYEIGLIKYIIKTPLTAVGFISMYIFGGGLLSIGAGVTTFTHGGNVAEAVVAYFLTEYLPPTAIEDVLVQVAVGACAAGLLWYISVPKNGR